MLEAQIASLNSEQRQVALCDKHCLAVAAPGSGKTKTLAVKAARLLSMNMRVVAVTFTRDSAIELRDRILSIAGNDVLPNLLVGTFHSIDLLMAFPRKSKSGMGSAIIDAGFSKLTRKWEIVKEANRYSFVSRAIAQAGLPLEVDQATAVIEGIKSGQAAPQNDEEKGMVETYDGLLKRHGVIDFQDILLETNKALKEGLISPLRTDHLLIDEFQDTDRTQFDWAMAHAHARVITTAVGDDDQSIYGFRRALGYRGMIDFVRELSAERIVLGTNYRSHSEVLVPAKKLISVNTDRMDKVLVSSKGAGGTALWEKYGDRKSEAKQCVRWSSDALTAGQSVGILARTNKRLDEVEAWCIRDQVPYVRTEGGSILKSSEMAVLMAMIGLIVDDESLDADQVLSWCKVSEEELTDFHRVVGKRGIANLTKKQLDQVTLSATSKKLIAMLARRREEWRVILEPGGVQFVLDGVIDVLVAPVSQNQRSINVLQIAKEVFSKPLSNKTGIDGLRERLRALRNKRDGVKQEEADDETRVALMTAHGSKGLEWDHVWVLGAEEGAFPDESASEQEERRLFFVAMTRARRHLMVSAAGGRPLSRFVTESQIERTPESVSD